MVERRPLQQVVVPAGKNPSSGLIHYVASESNIIKHKRPCFAAFSNTGDES